ISGVEENQSGSQRQPVMPVQALSAPISSSQPLSAQQTTSYKRPALSNATITEQLFSQQLEIISRQLLWLQQNGRSSYPGSDAQSTVLQTAELSAMDRAPTSSDNGQSVNPSPSPVLSTSFFTTSGSTTSSEPSAPEVYNPHRQFQIAPREEISELQREHLQEVIARHTSKTKTSKSHIQEYRPWMADTMTSNGFRSLWKELVYPIVAESAKGAAVYDIDGNRYVDITM